MFQLFQTHNEKGRFKPLHLVRSKMEVPLSKPSWQNPCTCACSNPSISHRWILAPTHLSFVWAPHVESTLPKEHFDLSVGLHDGVGVLPEVALVGARPGILGKERNVIAMVLALESEQDCFFNFSRSEQT